MLAITTDALRIRIATRPHYTRTNVQKEMIGIVLANHEILMPIVVTLTVNVMHFDAARQPAAVDRFSYSHMLTDPPPEAHRRHVASTCSRPSH